MNVQILMHTTAAVSKITINLSLEIIVTSNAYKYNNYATAIIT